MNDNLLPGTDPLTGLLNGRYVTDALRRALDAEQDGVAVSVAVLLADIFNFSVLNCSLGIEAGDEVLLAVTEAAKSVVRADEIVCRCGNYGRDEFLIILPSVTQAEAMRRANELLYATEKTPFLIQGQHKFRLALSIGVAHYLSIAPDAELSGAEALMRNAEIDRLRDRERHVKRVEAGYLSRRDAHNPAN